jgi:hypothetical protein
MTMTTKAPRVRARSISSLRRAAEAAGYAAACAHDDLEAPSGRVASLAPALALAAVAAAVALAAAVTLMLA